MNVNFKKRMLTPDTQHSSTLMDRNTWRKKQPWVFIAICFVMLLLPLFVTQSSMLFLLTNIFILAVFAMSYDILLGYTGIISFGHAMFFGFGAYSVALSLTYIEQAEVALLVALLAGVSFSVIVSFFVGLLSLRLKDTFYALITLAVATIFLVIAEQWRSFTRGDEGFNFTAQVPTELFGFINLIDRQTVYYLAFLFLIVMFLVLRQFIYSPVGRTLQAIRENESRVSALGYSIIRYKLISTIVAGVVASLAGMMYAVSIRFVNPFSTMDVDVTIDALLMVVIGGVGTLYGAIIGAGVIEIASHWLMGMRDVHPIFERWVILFGLVFIMSILFFPAGIVGTVREKWSKRKGKRSSQK
ncbi:branched-chain amino acid ABC transporter permease [Geomicrobium sp. JCM 19039]|uniref:branched-chain amino acid ABC transporter permease n=1 Tax=Geomicrobium sp. JCM 19039 TaxID=1460636 RepID=UPI00045F291A|nr:branched-chain amino acid ABC transporter permease [Geomicrobium sp. JCM 19039]GAK13284.1 branched-chain amino acid transport system permease protein LivM [Geomicrobium sp. JCM 19039]